MFKFKLKKTINFFNLYDRFFVSNQNFVTLHVKEV